MGGELGAHVGEEFGHFGGALDEAGVDDGGDEVWGTVEGDEAESFGEMGAAAEEACGGGEVGEVGVRDGGGSEVVF